MDTQLISYTSLLGKIIIWFLLMEKEGVQFTNGKAIPVFSDDDKDLDELLWGPD